MVEGLRGVFAHPGESFRHRASRFACCRCPRARVWPWVAAAWVFSNCRLATFSTALDRAALRRLAVFASAAAADAS
jgi:hypothetical protein